MTDRTFENGRERDFADVAMALVGEHGSLAAIRIAETLASTDRQEARIFWLGVAKAIRARQT
jgi:hypothetical protein